MYTRKLGTSFLIWIALLLAGCAEAAVLEAQPTEQVEPYESTVEVVNPPSQEASPGFSGAVISLAIEDLASQLEIDETAIRLGDVEPVVWPDASLGCAQTDQLYPQVVTPGYRVILWVDEKPYDYRTDERGVVVLCQEPTVDKDTGRPGVIESGLDMFVEQALADLALRLSINTEEIEVIEAKSVVWPNAGLGCPHPDMKYKQVPQDGLLIRLRYGGVVYSYHGGGGREIFLCEQPFSTSKEAPPKLDEGLFPPPGSIDE